jgi:hypothetical protein
MMSSCQHSITVSWVINVISIHLFDSVCNHCNALLRSVSVLNCTLFTDRYYVMTVTIIINNITCESAGNNVFLNCKPNYYRQLRSLHKELLN